MFQHPFPLGDSIKVWGTNRSMQIAHTDRDAQLNQTENFNNFCDL